MERSKTLSMAVLVILSFLFVGCNESETFDSSEKGIPLGFAIKMNSQSLDSRVAIDPNSLSAEKFIIVAYEKMANNKYKYCKATSSKANTYANSILSNSDFSLPVGVYRFLCLYNAEGDIKFDYYTKNEKDEDLKTWDEILTEAKLSRTDASKLDINEIFSFSSPKDINLYASEGRFMVSMELTRVNSRIDILIRKIYKDASGNLTEVGYTDSDVMGGASKLSKVSTETNGCSSAWKLCGQSEISNNNYIYDDTDNGHILVGTKEEGSSVNLYGTSVTDPHKINTISAQDFKKGTCYYKGAYILPFEGKTTSASSSDMTVEVSFHQTATNRVRIVEVEKVKAKENHVSLITLNLITLKEPDSTNNNAGDDGEDIFNPNVQCEVKINTIWAGVENTEVDI